MITKINPGELHTPPGYHHVTIVEAGRTAHLAGQCPVGPDGRVVGVGDLDAQIDQVVANSMVALGAAGASPEDVIRTVIYVVSDQVDVLGAAWDQLCDSELGAAFTTASTLLGVAQLGFPGQLIEVDLTAALRLLGTALGARGSGLGRAGAGFGELWRNFPA
jgi:enamine deaminase RidA (YjgF/YER057c/UK114 family)